MQIYTAITGDPRKIELIKEYGLGIMISSHPRVSLGKHLKNIPCALDNGAFSAWQHGYPFDEYAFLKTMSGCFRLGLELDFITCPDIVANGTESLKFSREWRKRLNCQNLALVVQDGMDPYAVVNDNYYRFKTIFIGGTPEWKWHTAPDWICWARKMNMTVHIGRCGTVETLQTARELGADSCDSTNMVRNDRFDIYRDFVKQSQTKLPLYSGERQ